MMKKNQDMGKKKQAKNEEEKVSLPSSIYGKDNKTFIVIDAKPNSKTSSVVGINDEGVRVNIGAPPKEGEANKELVEFLAGVIGAKKSEVYLDKGSKSKSKIIVVDGADPQAVYEALKENIEE